MSAYAKLKDVGPSYLLESVEGGSVRGRYSIIGLPCRRTYAFYGKRMETRDDGELVEQREVDAHADDAQPVAVPLVDLTDRQ